MTKEHEQSPINLKLDWAIEYTGPEDTDFWHWFWLWYKDFDEKWSYDHQIGWEDMNSDGTLKWEFLQDHTRGHDETLDAMIIDKDDSA